jgi:ribonuclease BN (tRNA processing enzyme)
MDKYKILKDFRDIHTKEKYVAESEIVLTEERAAEINENLKDKGIFIERVKTPKEQEEGKFDREEAKEKLTELGVDFKGNASNETLQELLKENEQPEEQEEVEEGK